MNKEYKAIKAGIGYTIGNYLIKGLTFFSIPIFSKILNPSDYGVYNTFLAYESIIYIIMGFALHSSYKNAKYKYLDRYEEYIANTIIFIILHTILWIIVINIISMFGINIFGFNQLILNVLIIYSFSTSIIICYNSYLSLEYKYKEYMIVAVFNAIGNIFLSILLIYTLFNNERYLGRIFGTLIPTLLISIYICFSLTKKYQKKIKRDYIKWGLKYSLPIIPHGISQVILNQFDRIMINNLISSIAAGIYSFAYNIFSIVSVTSTSIATAWAPWFYEKMNKKEYVSIKNNSSVYFVIMLLLCLRINDYFS